MGVSFVLTRYVAGFCTASTATAVFAQTLDVVGRGARGVEG
jgi:hypothetical protein